MQLVEAIFVRSILRLILCGLDFGFLLGGYNILRALRISANWVTWILGSFLIALGVTVCLIIIIPGLAPGWFGRSGNLVGNISFFIAVYAASQWIMRHWYVQVKRQATQMAGPGFKEHADVSAQAPSIFWLDCRVRRYWTHGFLFTYSVQNRGL